MPDLNANQAKAKFFGLQQINQANRTTSVYIPLEVVRLRPSIQIRLVYTVIYC